MNALICPRCGAPLPETATSGTNASCAYCGVTVSMIGARPRVEDDSKVRSPLEKLKKGLMLFSTDVDSGLATGGDPMQTLREALERRLGMGSREADVVTKVAFGMAADFKAETKADVGRDATALARLAQAYLQGLDDLAEKGEAEVNLPFFGATDDGPKHLSRKLTVADVEAFARGETTRKAKRKKKPKPAEPTPDQPAAEAPKKRWWWPFD